MLVISAFVTSERVIIAIGVTNTNGAQGMQVIVNKLQDFFNSFPGVAQNFANRECRKAFVKFIKAGDGEQMIVAIGRRTRSGHCPE